MSRLLVSRTMRLIAARSYSAAAMVDNKIGNREIVGYGVNGTVSYVDRADFPMPSVRFMPETPDIKQLREKEKGDWKKLSLAEKKALYRASFCQTFAEMNAPTGEWKSILGTTLMFMSGALWLYMFFKVFAYDPVLPKTFGDDRQKAQLGRFIDLKANPITGLASKWDYEKNDWKK